jgi:hypothetical protein
MHPVAVNPGELVWIKKVTVLDKMFGDNSSCIYSLNPK